MAKISKNMIYIILGIGLVFFLFIQPRAEEQVVRKGAQADVASAVIGRVIDYDTFKVGTTFDITYMATGYGSGSWGVLIEDTATGGCSPATINTGFLGPGEIGTVETITAPAIAGTCTFSGTYIFASSTDKPIGGANTVTICQDACTSGQIGCYDANTRWTCDTSGVCGVQINSACTAYEFCDTGICVPDCSGNLKPDALMAITTWSISPTAENKATALTAIVLWASVC